MASDGVVSVTILTSLSPLGEPVVTVDGTILVCCRFPPLVLPCSLDSPVLHSGWVGSISSACSPSCTSLPDTSAFHRSPP